MEELMKHNASFITSGPLQGQSLVSLLSLHILYVWVINIAFRSDENMFHLPHVDN